MQYILLYSVTTTLLLCLKCRYIMVFLKSKKTISLCVVNSTSCSYMYINFSFSCKYVCIAGKIVERKRDLRCFSPFVRRQLLHHYSIREHIHWSKFFFGSDSSSKLDTSEISRTPEQNAAGRNACTQFTQFRDV